MSYSVQIERLDASGMPVGQSVVHAAQSESEAVALMRDAIRRACRLGQTMTFSVYGPGNRQVLSYTNEMMRHAPDDAGAAAP